MRRPSLVEELSLQILEDFGQNKFGDVKLDDMSRRELYAVIRMLSHSSDLLLSYSVKGGGKP
jgi:hypothetical protein